MRVQARGLPSAGAGAFLRVNVVAAQLSGYGRRLREAPLTFITEIAGGLAGAVAAAVEQLVGGSLPGSTGGWRTFLRLRRPSSV
jgi:hypothetical protein